MSPLTPPPVGHWDLVLNFSSQNLLQATFKIYENMSDDHLNVSLFEIAKW